MKGIATTGNQGGGESLKTTIIERNCRVKSDDDRGFLGLERKRGITRGVNHWRSNWGWTNPREKKIH